MITQERLKEVLTYDEETGVFRWRKATGPRAKVGNNAGCTNKFGYRLIKIDGIMYRAHRLAWLYVYGSFPENEIDHVNGDKGDNRISNLRDVAHRVNGQNQACHRDGKLVGVHWDKDREKWRARIRVNGKQQFLGYYDTEEEGHAAYLEALGSLHG